MGKNTQRLGNILAARMTKTARANAHIFLELGVINEDLSLTTDSLIGKISPDNYMISLHYTHKNYFTYNELNSSAKAPHVHTGGAHEHAATVEPDDDSEGAGEEGGTTEELTLNSSEASEEGTHTHDSDGLHDHRVPSVFRRVKVGDRVLVAWVGDEPIIVDVVVAGTTITKN